MTDESKSEKDAKTKAPRELKPEELEKVAGGLVGDDIGLPLAAGKGGGKGFQVGGTNSDILGGGNGSQIEGTGRRD